MNTISTAQEQYNDIARAANAARLEAQANKKVMTYPDGSNPQVGDWILPKNSNVIVQVKRVRSTGKLIVEYRGINAADLHPYDVETVTVQMCMTRIATIQNRATCTLQITTRKHQLGLAQDALAWAEGRA